MQSLIRASPPLSPAPCTHPDPSLGVDVADVGRHSRGARNIVQRQLADIRGQLQGQGEGERLLLSTSASHGGGRCGFVLQGLQASAPCCSGSSAAAALLLWECKPHMWYAACASPSRTFISRDRGWPMPPAGVAHWTRWDEGWWQGCHGRPQGSDRRSNPAKVLDVTHSHDPTCRAQDGDLALGVGSSCRGIAAGAGLHSLLGGPGERLHGGVVGSQVVTTLGEQAGGGERGAGDGQEGPRVGGTANLDPHRAGTRRVSGIAGPCNLVCKFLCEAPQTLHLDLLWTPIEAALASEVLLALLPSAARRQLPLLHWAKAQPQLLPIPKLGCWLLDQLQSALIQASQASRKRAPPAIRQELVGTNGSAR